MVSPKKYLIGLMFYHINQLCSPSKSDVIVRSVKISYGTSMLVVAVIIVDADLFGAFSDLTCHLEDTGIGLFWLHCAT